MMQKSRDWIEDIVEPRPHIIKPGPIPTIGAFLASDAKCFWAYCEKMGCGHVAPIALAPFAIRWGMEASSDLIRARLRCSACGKKGDVSIKRPSWNGGFQYGLSQKIHHFVMQVGNKIADAPLATD